MEDFTDPKTRARISSFMNVMQVGQTQTLYRVMDNRIEVLVELNIIGTRLNRHPPMPILAPPGQEWSYNDRGDNLRFRASTTSITVGDRFFEDCIVVEERIVAENTTLRTKRSYFARGTGLVLVTLQGRDGNTTIFMQLVGYNESQ